MWSLFSRECQHSTAGRWTSHLADVQGFSDVASLLAYLTRIILEVSIVETMTSMRTSGNDSRRRGPLEEQIAIK